ncbi:MAG: hypothetical protein EA397_11805 [Deltaproteobacteria bacterium]|nr:MAG: hypothetical protein EA397_11805 [Deltaproteobacteria bacterium]
MCALLLSLLVATSGAADPDERPEPPDAGAASSTPEEEIIVIGEGRIEEAFDDLIESFDRAGWKVHKERDDGTIILRHRHDRWKGSFVVTPQGSIRTRRPVAYNWSVTLPLIIPHPEGLLPSKRKLKGPRTRTIAEVQPELQALYDAHAEVHAERNWDTMVARLDALWEHGEPLDGEARLKTHAERRAEVLAYWASRTETDAGRATMQRVSDWIEATIQTSPHPFTPAEIARAETQRLDGAKLVNRASSTSDQEPP